MKSDELAKLIESELINLLNAYTDLPEGEKRSISRSYSVDMASKINQARADKMFKIATLTSEASFDET